ncbi:MAG: hypothetical protein EOP84_12055, partial [Verrucomicrobiaceae bacterium]
MRMFRKLPQPRRTTGFILAGSIAALAVTSIPSRAATQTWVSGSVTSGLWSILANSVGDSAAPDDTSGTTSPALANFNAFGVNTWGNVAGNPIGINANRNIFGINCTGAAGSYFVDVTGSIAPKVSSGGSIQSLNTLTATNAVEIINAPLQIQGTNGAYTLDNNSANGSGTGAGILNFGGGIARRGAGSTVLTLTGSNWNANTIGGGLVNGAATTTSTVNVFGISGVTPAGTKDGPGRSLSGATDTLGRLLSNTNSTVSSPAAMASDLTIPVTSATTLSTAYWKGGLSGAPSTWAASDGSTQSNWVATPGGANQPLIPDIGTDVIFSNSTVTTSPASSTLGANMTIRSLTQRDTANPVSLNADGFSLTITPSNPTAGITMVSGAR